MENTSITEFLKNIYNSFGPRKPMGNPAVNNQHPHFFLVRSFLGETDLAILFNTKRCRYKCKFCNLPAKSTKQFISSDDISLQYRNVLEYIKHSIGVIDRVTIANEGSVFDYETFPRDVLFDIANSTNVVPTITRIVLESRLEFVESKELIELKNSTKKTIDILTGFESLDEHIIDIVLHKEESINSFLIGLEKISESKSSLTAYVLYKPSQEMTDEDAFYEAEKSIDFLIKHTRRLKIPLCIRLNPMYAAQGTPWAKIADNMVEYRPPKLSDVLSLAMKKDKEGIPIYLGLTSEGLALEKYTYRAREDFSTALLKNAILWNKRKIKTSSIVD